VPDTGTAIADAVADALGRADLVVTTGGLGPTADDRTREEVARRLGRELRFDRGIYEGIAKVFERLGRPLPPNFSELATVQSQVPDGAVVLNNPTGTAPGLMLEVAAGGFRSSAPSWLVMLPGPPRELRPMFEQELIPQLRRLFPVGNFCARTFHTLGIGESRVEDALRRPLALLMAQGLEVGYCARTGEVDVRISASGENAGRLVDEASAVVRRLLARFLYAEDGRTLEEQVVDLLRERGETLVTAESCTGGLLAHTLTNVPGASGVFPGGLITYSNDWKQALLGVNAETLAVHGAVSEETAREMALGARERYRADHALAITGIAGPDGGSPEKPVGTVYLALASASGVEVRREFNPFERETFKLVTARKGLEMVRRRLTEGREALGNEKPAEHLSAGG